MKLPESLVLSAPRVYDPSTGAWALDRELFDVLLNEKPFLVWQAVNGAIQEYGQMQKILRQALEIACPEVARRWAGLPNEQIFTAENRAWIRGMVNSLTDAQLVRINTQLR